jgi:hypothetical protein
MLEEAVLRASVAADCATVRKGALALLDAPDAGRAFRYHPLGFLDWVLMRNEEHRLQIHIWDPIETRRQELVSVCHSHGWHLRSHVLAGALVNQTYRVAATPEGDHQLFRVDYAARNTASISTEMVGAQVEIAIAREDTFEAGNTYEVAPSEFHATMVLRRPAVTVVVGDLEDAVGAENIRPRGAPSALRYEREEVAPAVVRDACARAVAAIREHDQVSTD